MDMYDGVFPEQFTYDRWEIIGFKEKSIRFKLHDAGYDLITNYLRLDKQDQLKFMDMMDLSKTVQEIKVNDICEAFDLRKYEWRNLYQFYKEKNNLIVMPETICEISDNKLRIGNFSKWINDFAVALQLSEYQYFCLKRTVEKSLVQDGQILEKSIGELIFYIGLDQT